MRPLKLLAVSGVSLSGRYAVAEITATVDKLDPSDGIPMPPPNLVIVDLAIDVTPDDAFAAMGINADAYGGAELQYARDPNGIVIPTAPGIENRFVTFFSRPRLRDGNGRFGPAGEIAVTGGYYGGPGATFNATNVNAVSFVTIYEPGRDGYVLRLALNLSSVTDPAFRVDSPNIVVAASPPQGSTVLLETSYPGHHGVGVYSQNNLDAFLDFGVYGIPEPASGVLLLILAGAALRRR